MAENSKISWTTHTFSPWVGCTKVSPACDNCYAEAWAKRFGHDALWQGERRRTTEKNWNKVRQWDRAARASGDRPRVFCSSLADVFDNQVPAEWRVDLWQLIHDTPNLDWLLLTKRPQNIAKMLPSYSSGGARTVGLPNVWLGTTVENELEAQRRVPYLLAVRAAVHFLSCEPLLSGLRLNHIATRDSEGNTMFLNALAGEHFYPGCGSLSSKTFCGKPRIDWVIVGGESGRGARPFDLRWASDIAEQCKRNGTAFWMKQLGHCPVDGAYPYSATGKGDILEEWPLHLQLQQFPQVRHAA